MAAASLMIIHGALLGWASYVNSPNLDEPAHLAAGVRHWKLGRFDLYRVNPPLIRIVAAVPILFTDATTDPSNIEDNSLYARPEFQAGKQFVNRNSMACFWYFTLARWACIPMCLTGLWVVYMWAKELHGTPAGLLAMFLYCFCPNLIAWGASITPDAAGAAFGVVAAYSFWKWLNNPSLRKALQAGLALGFAELAKSTWIVLFALWPIIWLVLRLTSPKQPENNPATTQTTIPASVKVKQMNTANAPFQQLVVILLTALYLLNLVYGFEGSLTRLREYKFVSKTLSGQDYPLTGANRFDGSWIGLLPVPLPEHYVRGLDIQKFEFERGKMSYLWGEHRKGGWWYYYIFALAVKSPIGTLAMVVAATASVVFRRAYSSGWRNELILLFPSIVFLFPVSSQTGFSRYLRYALPVLPFIYIHVSRLARAISTRQRCVSGSIFIFCTMTAVESLTTFPHTMSFFNGIVGGPLNGHAYLLDANIDWGQDLHFLKNWYDENPTARPFHLAYFGDMNVSPKAVGIIGKQVPGFLPVEDRMSGAANLLGLQSGWYAVSINHVKGYRHYQSEMPRFAYFQRLQPIARAGYSIYIYHLTLDQANTLRAELKSSQAGLAQEKWARGKANYA